MEALRRTRRKLQHDHGRHGTLVHARRSRRRTCAEGGRHGNRDRGNRQRDLSRLGSDRLAPIAPEDLFAPSIEGNLTSGDTLTAQTGTWVSSEAISYAYQWQKCDEEGEECANISGATSSTYKLVEGDIDSTLRVVVTGENTLGTASMISEQTEIVGTAGPPANTDRPAIEGSAEQGEQLVADNGTWSGSRPLSYYYRWERCNSAGESCTAIEGATKPSYTVVSGDVGSTLRVKVTATNSLGSAGAVSIQTIVVAGGEASVMTAIELAEKTDPSVLQPATTETLEEQKVKPAISDSGESLSGTTALTSSSISKETPGEFAVNTPDGEVSFQPVDSAPSATKTPTIVNGAAAVFAGTSNATDTIVRPDALGATTLLQLRSSEAPTSFSWEVGLGPNQRLEKLSDGDIAVVEVPATSPLEGSLGEPLESPESSEVTAEHEGSGESGEAAESALEEGVSGEGALEKLSAAPTASTPAAEPKSGELHPQETKALYESANSTWPRQKNTSPAPRDGHTATKSHGRIRCYRARQPERGGQYHHHDRYAERKHHLARDRRNSYLRAERSGQRDVSSH